MAAKIPLYKKVKDFLAQNEPKWFPTWEIGEQCSIQDNTVQRSLSRDLHMERSAGNIVSRWGEPNDSGRRGKEYRWVSNPSDYAKEKPKIEIGECPKCKLSRFYETRGICDKRFGGCGYRYR